MMTIARSPVNSPLMNTEESTPPNSPLIKDESMQSHRAREILSADRKRSLDECDNLSPPAKKPAVLATQRLPDKWSNYCKSVSGHASYHKRQAHQAPPKEFVGSLFEDPTLPTFPTCSMPSAATSGYASYHKRQAHQVPSKEFVGSLFGKDTQPPFPTCSMPSAATSGYASYHKRQAHQVPSKEFVGSLFGKDTQPPFPTCSMPSAATSGYASYHDRNIEESGFVHNFDFFF